MRVLWLLAAVGILLLAAPGALALHEAPMCAAAYATASAASADEQRARAAAIALATVGAEAGLAQAAAAGQAGPGEVADGSLEAALGAYTMGVATTVSYAVAQSAATSAAAACTLA